MTEKFLCRCCGQPLPDQERAGVYMPAKKAAIFDIIKRYPTIPVEGIICQLNDGSTANCVRQHIYQINELLAATDTRISGNELYQRGYYCIVTTPKRKRMKQHAAQPRDRRYVQP